MSIFSILKKAYQLRFANRRNRIKRVSSFWQEKGPDFDYFQAADQENWVNTFWDESSPFRRQFEQLNPARILEIACGAGRHSWQVRDRVERLSLLDTSRGALELAARRFVDYQNVTYLHARSGKGMADCDIPRASLTAVFSFDAMVHFEPESVRAYLKDSFDSLEQGGRCLLHHSNFSEYPGGDFAKNPGWRNYMTLQIFNEFATEAGFRILHQETISFVAESSDALSLLEK